MNTDSDKLAALLKEWRVESTLPPRFNEGVWRRIEATDAPGTTLWQIARAWFDQAFARPAFALAYCGILIAAGLGLGFKQAQERSAVAEAQLEARYVVSISPYYKVHP